jgi:hypothetical protein
MKNFCERGFIRFGTVLAGALVWTSATQGQVADQLVLTENSSMSLTATLNGSPLTVLTTSSDHWLVGLQGVTGTALFAEPESSTEANFVQGDPGTAFVDMTVISDDTVVGAVFLANGATNTTDFHEVTGAPLDVTFHDLGDGPSVPDTATTLSLLGFSLAALGICRRKFLSELKT